MKYKKIMIMLVLAVFIFGAASVCASDVDDTVIAREDDSIVELSQADADEIMLTDENELISQTDNGLISEGNSGTFAELQANINALTNGSTITLNKNYECEDGFDGEGILIDKSITIDGQGNKINAQGKSRIFRITADNVILKNIIFTNGISGNGGAVYFEKSGNVINCNFTDNDAMRGGAVYFNSAGDVINCTFTGNTANKDGGAIFWWNGNGQVINSTFNNNTAVDGGGAICWWNGNGHVIESIFVNNTAFNGRSIYSWGSVTVYNPNSTDSNEYDKTTYGELYFIFDVKDYSKLIDVVTVFNTFNINGATINLKDNLTVTSTLDFKTNSNITINGNGYTIDCNNKQFMNIQSENTLVLNNITLKNGHSDTHGGAIKGSGHLIIINSIFNNNTADTHGGAIFWESGNVQVTDSNFTNNAARYDGGAIYWEDWSGHKGQVTGSTFTKNVAEEDGGAIYWYGPKSTVTGSTFNNNKAENRGGAIFWCCYDECMLFSSTFKNNTANQASNIYNVSYVYNSSCIYVLKDNIFCDSVESVTYTKDISTVTINSVVSIYYDGLSGIFTKSKDHVLLLDEYTLQTYAENKPTTFPETQFTGLVDDKKYIIALGDDDGNKYTIKNSEFEIVLLDKVYVSPTGTGNGLSSTNPANWTTGYENAANNATLIFLPGTYNIIDYTIDKSLNLTGEGKVTIDADGKGRIFTINAENVTIQNLRLINGKTKGAGGAIYWTGTNGQVINSTFNNNTASDYGGAVYIDGGNVTNCNFADNTARLGNAIYINNWCTISDCNFTNNPITKGAIHSLTGGIILSNNIFNFDDVVEGRNFTEIQKLIDQANEGDEITIDGLYTGFGIPIMITKSLTLIGQNNATLDAKKLSKTLYISANNVIIKNIQFTNGYADSGGAVYFLNAGTVTNCNFTNNTATEKGGALYFSEEGTVTNCYFTDNKATGRYSAGGALYFGSNSVMTNCNFTNNTVTDEGGAIYFGDDSTVTNCYFADNKATGYFSAGGALYFECNGEMTNCNFINNTAHIGGAVFIFYVYDSIDNVINCNFTGNTARESCAINFSNNANVINCTFNGNIATNDDDHAIYFANNGNVTNCNFINNKAGSIQVSGSSRLAFIKDCNFTNNSNSNSNIVQFADIIENCNFINNTARCCVDFYKGSLINCNFIGNSALTGGIVERPTSVINCSFINNHAVNGGAINGDGSIENCNFINNSASGDGGAIYGGWYEVKNCIFINNSASGTGGAIKAQGIIENCNFTNNSAYAAAISSREINLKNCSFTANTGDCVVESAGLFNVLNCNFTNNPAQYATHGGTNISFENSNFINSGTAIWSNAQTHFPLTLFYSCNVANCNFINNHGRSGIVYHSYAICNITCCNFINNAADDWSTVFGYKGIIKNSNLINNYAPWGGVYLRGVESYVINCNFTNNTATRGGAVYLLYGGAVTNCNFTNNTATGDGSTVNSNTGTGTVSNCNFTNNIASEWGGAIRMIAGTVSNCNFTNNSARLGGGAININSGSVLNCSFMGNTANDGGAIRMGDGAVSNCNFTGNNATTGSAIYFDRASALSNSILLNNRADAKAVDVVKNEDNITITFTGGNNLLNAIYSEGDVTFTNVTYWGANGITTVSDTMSGSNKVPGQNVTVEVIVNGVLVLNDVYVTDENGTIVLENMALDGNYFITARHDDDSYYTGVERTISNMTFNVNVTSQITPNKTVNITAKSNIYSEFMPGKLLFILTDGTEINATYGANGIWWAEYAFDDYGVYQVTASYIVDNVTVSNGTIAVTAPEHTFWFLNYTINGNDNPVIELSNDFYFDPAYDSAFVNGIVINRPVTINGNGIVIDAKGQARIFDVQSADTVIENLTLKNANYNSGNGGAIHFASSGTVSNCNFTNNTAYEGGAVYFTGAGIVSNCTFTGNTARWYGGALRFRYTSDVSNCTFTGNTATGSGGAIYSLSGTLTNCTFIGNTATGSGGAIMFVSSTTVSNCNFNDNSASSGGAVWMSYGGVSNSNFIGNNATTGSAIYFGSASTLSNSILLNNRADAEVLDMVKNDDNITITFTGRNNLLNAIHSEGDVTFTNVTYWGADGIATVSATMSGSNKEAGQNITVEVVVNGVLVLNDVYVTDENGTIVLENMNLDGNYFITVRHDDDSYYTRAETILTNMELHANVTSIATNNRTVNLTAKSNIYGGKFQFVLSDGTKIDANYASNGIWWAVYTFDDYGEYNVSASYLESGNVTVSNGTITINKLQTVLTGNAVTAVYNINKNLVITLKDAKGNPLSGASVTVNLNGLKTYTTDSNGQIKVSTKGLAPKAYTAKVTFNGNANYVASAKDIKVTVKKATPKMTAKKKTFKRTVKTKKYTIVLKDNTGKAMKKVKVTLKIKGKKTITAKTNSKGKATFKIKKLTKKGTYKTTVTFKGNKYYNKVVKKVKIKIK